MKAITLGVLCACALTLAVSISVNASSITLLDVANSQVRDGAYAGFYTLNIDGQNVLAMCDDFATNSTIGETWTGTIFSYPTINSGAGKFGPNPVAYSQVGWLFSQAPSVSFTDQASIDEAIWKIMDPVLGISAAGMTYFNSATSGSHEAFNYTNYIW